MPDVPDARADQISKHLDLSEESILLRIFIGEGDRLGHQPLSEAIVLRARSLALPAPPSSAAQWDSENRAECVVKRLCGFPPISRS